jgi:hypothetical protein
VLRLVRLLLLLLRQAGRHVCQPDALGWAVIGRAISIQQLQQRGCVQLGGVSRET